MLNTLGQVASQAFPFVEVIPAISKLEGLHSHSSDIQTKVASWNQKIMMVSEVLQTLAWRRERETHTQLERVT